METAEAPRPVRPLIDLETFLVEWKPLKTGLLNAFPIGLETFLVEWKRFLFWHDNDRLLSLKPS